MLINELSDPRLYAGVIARLSARPERWSRERLSIGALQQRQGEFSKRLARAVSSGAYELGPVRERLAFVGGKERRLYSASLVDTVVLSALSQVLARACEPHLSPRLFSYRTGRSASELVREFGAYVKEHRASRPDPKQRGLFVLRADVASYGESIPVHESSPLWPALRDVLASDSAGVVWRLIEQAIHPVVHGLDGRVAQRTVGVPTGSPIQPLICNLYLTSVDSALGQIPGAFFGRFGDDLLLSHADSSVVKRAEALLEARLEALELRLSPDKRQLWYFTSSGTAPKDCLEGVGATPTQFVTYLGARVDFTGRVGLPAGKLRRLLESLKSRLDTSDDLLREPDRSQRLSDLCSVVRAALDPRSPTADPSAVVLGDAVTDTKQLQQLDYWVALHIAERIARCHGPRAFRRVPYRELREAGLWSALHVANVRHRRADQGARP